MAHSKRFTWLATLAGVFRSCHSRAVYEGQFQNGKLTQKQSDDHVSTSVIEVVRQVDELVQEYNTAQLTWRVDFVTGESNPRRSSAITTMWFCKTSWWSRKPNERSCDRVCTVNIRRNLLGLGFSVCHVSNKYRVFHVFVWHRVAAV